MNFPSVAVLICPVCLSGVPPTLALLMNLTSHDHVLACPLSMGMCVMPAYLPVIQEHRSGLRLNYRTDLADHIVRICLGMFSVALCQQGLHLTPLDELLSDPRGGLEHVEFLPKQKGP
ncbi:hypothetical protein WMY93_019480 [Mugilogobius chulae]|uniref:Uncharacterized protein n=1 Tax=Mugilogobius chulae TaxID=88201 RepID=A0AAW0NIY1_9GOBI